MTNENEMKIQEYTDWIIILTAYYRKTVKVICIVYIYIYYTQLSPCVKSHDFHIMIVLSDFRQFGKPNLSQLINLVGVTVKNEWRAIGVGLGVMVADLDSFQEEEAGKIDATQHCMQRVFQKWHAAVTSEYSWVNLVQVLESPAVNRKAAVQELYESLCAQNK